MISNKPATNQQRKIFDESTRKRVQLQRRHVNIPVHIAVHRAAPIEEDGGLLTIQEAAKELGLAPSTSHRWLGGGFIGGEQATLGAAEDPAHSRDPFAFADDAPAGWFAILEATFPFGVAPKRSCSR